MIIETDIAGFLAERSTCPIVDVRSPSEYAKAHIPGAVSLPLFSDTERAEVGTLYKKKGSQSAVLRGLDFVGPKMRSLVEEAGKLVPDRKLLLHCWRGGMRSGSVAWLLDLAGFEVHLLKGGYQAYRRHVHQVIERERHYLILGGKTGSGKTEVLHGLQAHGEQVVDLEGLANHRGSSFGGIGQEDQPSTEHFENMLCDVLAGFSDDRPVWLEDESRRIGRVYLPDSIYGSIQTSKVLAIEVGKENRVERLVRDYGDAQTHELAAAIDRIAKRLGGQHVQAAQEALAAGDLAKVADITLTYYDKTYTHGLKRRGEGQVDLLELSGYPVTDHPQQILNHVRKHNG